MTAPYMDMLPPTDYNIAPNRRPRPPVNQMGMTTAAPTTIPVGVTPAPPQNVPRIPTMAPQTGVTTSPTVPTAPNTPTLNRVFQSGNVSGVTGFGPGNSLIGAQINPVTDPRLAGAESATDTARGRYTGFNEGTYGPITANTSKSEGVYDTLLKLAQSGGGGAAYGGGFAMPAALSGDIGRLTSEIGGGGPDRAKLASDAYNLFLERSAPQDEQLQRSIGQRAAALGRVGSGVTTNELGDLGLSIERTRDQARRELANTAAGQTLSDRLQALNALRGVAGDYASSAGGAARSAQQAEEDKFNRLLTLGRDIYGRESDVYGRGVGERDFAVGREGELYGRRRGEFGDLATEENRIADQGRINREELRGERGYQAGLERESIARRGAQRQAEEDALDAAERRRLAEAQLLGGAGGQAPVDLLAGVGGARAGAGAEAIGGAADYLSNLLLRRQMGRRPTQPLVPETQPYIPMPNIPEFVYNDPRFG